ncbi:hypothetical protein ACU686_11265 [Yinghuangia aomiensis]
MLTAYSVPSGGIEFRIAEAHFHHQFSRRRGRRRSRPHGGDATPGHRACADGRADRAPGLADRPLVVRLRRDGPQHSRRGAAVHGQTPGSRGTRAIAGASHAVAVSRPEEVAATILEAVDGAQG